MRSRSLWPLFGIAVAPLALAALGVTHPQDLTAATAPYWRRLHVGLLPLFPLLGVNLWWLSAGAAGVVAWLARALAFVYIAFYTALDVLAGIATGLVVERASASGTPVPPDVTVWLFTQASALAEVGVWAFVLACALTCAVVLRRGGGLRAVAGSLLLVLGAVVFSRSHIYFPEGVAAMLLMAGGFPLLQWARLSNPSTLAHTAQTSPA